MNFTTLIVVLLITASPSPLRSRHEPWKPGTYSGFTVGACTKDDILKRLGPPVSVEEAPDEPARSPDPQEWLHYALHDPPLSGEIVYVIGRKTTRLERIDIYPANLSKSRLIAHFGSGFTITHYDFDKCLGDEESAPLYEAKNGPLEFVEYRGKGIAALVNYQQRVQHVSFVAKPLGAPISQCVPAAPDGKAR